MLNLDDKRMDIPESAYVWNFPLIRVNTTNKQKSLVLCLQNQQTCIHLANIFPDLTLCQALWNEENKLGQFTFSRTNHGVKEVCLCTEQFGVMVKGTGFSVRQNLAWVSALPLTRKLFDFWAPAASSGKCGGRQSKSELLSHWSIVWIKGDNPQKALAQYHQTHVKSLIGVSYFHEQYS